MLELVKEKKELVLFHEGCQYRVVNFGHNFSLYNEETGETFDKKDMSLSLLYATKNLLHEHDCFTLSDVKIMQKEEESLQTLIKIPDVSKFQSWINSVVRQAHNVMKMFFYKRS